MDKVYFDEVVALVGRAILDKESHAQSKVSFGLFSLHLSRSQVSDVVAFDHFEIGLCQFVHLRKWRMNGGYHESGPVGVGIVGVKDLLQVPHFALGLRPGKDNWMLDNSIILGLKSLKFPLLLSCLVYLELFGQSTILRENEDVGGLLESEDLVVLDMILQRGLSNPNGVSFFEAVVLVSD